MAEERDIPLLSRYPRRCPFKAHFGPDQGIRPESPARGIASAGRVRPLAGLVRIDGLLIVLDRSHGRARRRTLGPVPQLQVAKDLLENRAVVDQADDFERPAAAGADQGIRFVDFLDPPSPRTPACAAFPNSGACRGIRRCLDPAGRCRQRPEQCCSSARSRRVQAGSHDTGRSASTLFA